MPIAKAASSWQLTAILMLALVVFGGGSMTLLVLGRDVPGFLIAIDGGLANAIVALAGFLSQQAMQATALGHMMGAVDRIHLTAEAGINALVRQGTTIHSADTAASPITTTGETTSAP